MKIDLHSHILPGIDDGSRCIEESVALLDKMSENGINVVVATPHFYCHEQSVDNFINARNEAYESLKPHLKPNHPKILLGAEVLYHPVLVGNEELYKLKIQGTDFVLIEMPYTPITSEIIENMEIIADSMDVKIIVAHIERYLHFTTYSSLTALMNLDVLGQINTRSLNSFSSKRACFKLIKQGYVQALGSDAHRIDKPILTVNDVYKIIDKKFGEGYTEKLMTTAEYILENKDMKYFL